VRGWITLSSVHASPIFSPPHLQSIRHLGSFLLCKAFATSGPFLICKAFAASGPFLICKAIATATRRAHCLSLRPDMLTLPHFSGASW
jgi:hypothetical protein